MGEMVPQRSHARSTSNVYHLFLRRLDVEVAEGADGVHLVARLQVEEVAGAKTRRAILPRRRRRDAHVEFKCLLLRCITCQ